MKLKNKTAIITGGGRGIGRAIAEVFAREGADLFLISRTASELEVAKKDLEQQNIRVEIETADVSKEKDVEKVFNRIKKDFGTIDVLVNAAGIYGPIGKLEETEPAGNKEMFVCIFFVGMFCRL